jgi:hypothetical protein
MTEWIAPLHAAFDQRPDFDANLFVLIQF